jgi:glycosyltransferase involved in cell wall biosynthesis
MKSKIYLTICIVTADREKEFIEALESVKNLTFYNYKVIVADDSKTDIGKKITKKILPEAIYFRNIPPLREIANSNKCISLATTEYVCLFHDDDVFQPEYFTEIIKQMLKDKNIDMAYTGRTMINENGATFVNQVLSSNKKIFIYNAQDILDFMLLGKKYEDYRVFINTPGLVFKREIFEKINGFDNSVDTHCDTNFLLKSLAISNKVLFVNQSLFKNRIWHGVSGRTKSSEKGTVYFAEKGVIDNFLQFCKVQKLDKYIKKEKEIYRKYSYDAIAINGPLGWIALRFKGSFWRKKNVLLTTAKAIIRLNREILFSPKFYFIFLSSFLLPSFVIRLIHGPLLTYYLKKT